ncbi:MAG: hypothetical protein K8L97_20495 [Anaerolineae bacterium]|nr:hypothetical protein [Anaerolineae bacterium]
MDLAMLVGIGISAVGWLLLFVILLYQGMPSLHTGIIPPAWSMPPDLWLLGSTPFSGTIGWLIFSFTLIVLGNVQIISVAGEYSVSEVWLSTFLNSGELKHFPIEIAMTWIAGKLVLIVSIIWKLKHDRIEAMEKNQHGTHVVISHHQAQVMRVGQFIWMTFIAFLLGLIDGSLTIPVLPCIAPSLFPDTTDIVCSTVEHISSVPIQINIAPLAVRQHYLAVMGTAFITAFVGIVLIWMMIQAISSRFPVSPEVLDVIHLPTTWSQGFLLFGGCGALTIVFSFIDSRKSLIELVWFQLGVVLNFYVFASFGRSLCESFLSVRQIRQPDWYYLELRKLEPIAMSAMRRALIGGLIALLLVGIGGGGIYGMGIAIAGAIVGGVAAKEDDRENYYKSKIALWQFMAKQRTPHKS